MSVNYTYNSVGGPIRPTLLSPLLPMHNNRSNRGCAEGKSRQDVKATSLAKQDFLDLGILLGGFSL